MNKLVAIGEALIDFIPNADGAIKDVEYFIPKVGGAPANVCGAFSKLGGNSEIITQLGQDNFGDKILEEFKTYNIGTSYVARTDKANTASAFVALKKDGNREFSFYRNPSADMLMSENQIDKTWFNGCFAFHMCSVSLGDFPMKEAQRKAVEYAKESNAIISFDPNIRLPLFKNHEALKNEVLSFMKYADILKIADDELEFITGFTTIEDAKEMLFSNNVKVILYTKGKEGAELLTPNVHYFANKLQVNAKDTTGAGDAFIGSFLYSLNLDNVTTSTLLNMCDKYGEKYLGFSNLYSACSVERPGAIASYLTLKEINEIQLARKK